MEEASTPVKVYVRIRPQSDTTGLCSVKVIDNDQIQLGLERMFTFDHVFGPISSQVEVYSIAVYPLVSKFFNGINCTIFAYGQTGSGKTYTIGSGCSLGEQNEGIIARTVIDIFKNIEDSRNFNHLVTVSYLEIYKEELRDLLQDNLYNCNKDIVIREDDDKRTIITGIVEEEVGSVEDAIGWLECGNAARVTSATEMNAHSSRSHAVFTITLVQENTASISIDQTLNSRLISKFHFVDLAGSERVSRTNNVGERFKESIHINSGLLALGNVISALSDKRRKSTHIPYRDSKITRILKDSLGGSALTVMITCLSPSNLDLPESLNALKYAKRACRIKNHPVVNRDNDRKTTLLLTMREEVKSLRDELHKARETGLQSVGTMDSCAMMEFCDHDYLSSLIKKLLNRQKIIMDEAEAAYQYCKTDISIESEYQTYIRDVIEKLYYCIKANVLVDELENVETESKGTNTSCNNGVQQCDQCNNIQELKDELLFYKDTLTTTDEKCSNYTMENQTLQTKYNNCMKEVTGLRNEIEELTCAIKILQNELDTLKDGQQQSSDKNEINNHGNVMSSTAKMESIYSLVNGTVTNLQDFDEASCDMAMRQLTDILSSYHHKQSSAKPLIVIPCDHEVSEDLFDEEICRINENIESSQSQLHHTEKRLISAQHTMKSLGLKIRFKEELIKELVKNNSAFQCLNKAYQTKINNLEKEYQQLKLQVVKLNTKHPYEHTSISQSEIQSTSRGEELSIGRTKRKKAKSAVLLKAAELETKEKKLKETESKLLILQRRRQDTLRILNMGEKGEKRVSVLEGELERLRNQQGALKKKLKGESYRKRNLEEEVHQYKLQIKNLSESNKHQSQVIRVKTQEAAVAQRRLRNCQPGQLNNQIRNQKWFDQEIEKIVQQKHALEEFQKELLEREVIITNQEQLMKERVQLQTKLNQSSEAVTINCSQEMKNINQMIASKEKLKVSFSGQSLKDLKREISSLRDKREKLSDVFNLRSELSPDGVLSSDETRLMEVSEQIEVLETLLKIKNDDSINNFQTVQSVGSEMNGLSSKILALPTEEARLLLSVYINKIIKLRQDVEKSKRNQMELENQLWRQTQIVQNLEQSLDQSQIDKELRLSRLHKEHAKEVQVLLHHMTNSEDPVQNNEEMLTTRVKELERDLYYYKKTARDLKRKLKISVRTSSNTKEIKSTIVKDSLEL